MSRIMVSIIVIAFACAAFPHLAMADPHDGTGTMTVSPTTAIAGSTGNSFTFSFLEGSPANFPDNSVVTITVPLGWTAPQITNSSLPGFVSVAVVQNDVLRGTNISGSGPWTITITFKGKGSASGFDVTYAGGGNKITAPTIAATNIFTIKSQGGAGGLLTPIVTSPTITINPGPLDHFTIATPGSPQVAGTAFAIASIVAQDVYSNTVTTFTGTVDFSETGGGAGGTISPLQSSSFSAGVRSSQSVTLSMAGTAVTITATDSAGTGKTGTSGTFNVTPSLAANAANSVISASPASITANGTSTSTITVTEKNASGVNLTVSGVKPVLNTSAGSLSSLTDNGNGTFTATLTSATTVGTANITGTISGSAIGTPASINFTGGSVTVLASSLNPSPTGSNVIFTATVSALAPSTGTPAGTVIFKDGGTPFYTNTLVSGSTTATNSSLSHGTHAITAAYPGGGNFFGSTNTLNPNLIIGTQPTATNLALQRYPLSGVKIRTATVLGIASNPDQDTLSLASVGSPGAAGASATTNRHWLIYQPPAGYTNSDSLSYTIANPVGLFATNLVSISILVDPGQSRALDAVNDLGNGSFNPRFSGIAGRTYTIQYTENLQSPVWQSLGTSTANAAGIVTFTDTPGLGAPARFYRATYP